MKKETLKIDKSTKTKTKKRRNRKGLFGISENRGSLLIIMGNKFRGKQRERERECITD